MKDSSPIKEFYRRRYAAIGASSAGAFEEKTFARRVETALAAMPPNACRVLDFGCGRGAAASRFVEAGHRVVGVDISETVIPLARQLAPSAEFLPIAAENVLPFRDRSFDVCFASEVIEHMFDAGGFLREVRRVLVPGGLLALTTPYHGWLKNLLVVSANFEGHFNVRGGHIRFFSKRSISAMLDDEGFDIERIGGLGRFWPVWNTMIVFARARSA